MAIQYKEYLCMDKDIGELIMLKAANVNLFHKTMISIEDIEEMKIKDFMMELDEIVKKGQIIDFMMELDEIVKKGQIIDFLNIIAKSKLKKIIKLLILDADEIVVYNSYYKNHETHEEIGKKFGVTRQSISKKLKKINQKIENTTKLFEDEKIFKEVG